MPRFNYPRPPALVTPLQSAPAGAQPPTPFALARLCISPLSPRQEVGLGLTSGDAVRGLQLWVIMGLLSTVFLLGYLRGKFNQYHLAPAAHSLYVPVSNVAVRRGALCVGWIAGREEADGGRGGCTGDRMYYPPPGASHAATKGLEAADTGLGEVLKGEVVAGEPEGVEEEAVVEEAVVEEAEVAEAAETVPDAEEEAGAEEAGAEEATEEAAAQEPLEAAEAEAAEEAAEVEEAVAEEAAEIEEAAADETGAEDAEVRTDTAADDV